ncbi:MULTISPECIES: LuxR family transcriptional regulator [unclassified Arthrobacter]|uniref:helix-turn-helix transcriptional regulator n=1 Tax=unclassified Arthrobacter TaxID=235627 RepID=UPI001E357F36|nr:MULTISPECIES: LuxR family transcriptional regulator [unclassified Arthrobacter]MCC9146139.1 LuxR family transcriptional regulator [Arthrobacter sp. zg-Y919]MDK1277369.1 LuxR family transcriptional regulator [Arthrobacter sp. zg.Y919]WIB03866.1 LuxR family transcriptional regulator [Arthrobacter sp. zg-Y919]
MTYWGQGRQLFGRDRELAEITNRLLEPGLRGVVLLGAEGIGKSSLAELAAERLGSIMAPYYVCGSPVLSRMQYGILSTYLGAATAAEMESPLAVLRAVRAHFQRLAETSGMQTLLVVDNAQHIDEASAHLLSQLAMSGELRLMVISRARAPRIHELLSLARDGLLARIDLGPLPRQAVHEFCVSVLGGPVLQASSTLLSRMSGGNPLYVKELMARARRQKRLMEVNGAWYLTEEPDSLDTSLVDLVKGMLASRSPAERHVLETVALAERLPRSIVSSVSDEEAVRSLVIDGILEILPDRDESAHLVQPLHEDIIRSLVPAARSAEIRARIMERYHPGSLQDPGGPAALDALLRHAEWAMDCGERLAPEDLLAAARAANGMGDAARGQRFASAVDSLPLRRAAEVEVAAAYVWQGSYGLARTHLEALAAVADDAGPWDERSLQRGAFTTAMMLRQTNAQSTDVNALAHRWIEVATGLVPKDAASAQTPPGVSAGAGVLTAAALILDGAYTEACSRLAALAAEEGEPQTIGDAERALLIHGLYAEVLAACGEVGQALQQAQAATNLLDASAGQLRSYSGFVFVRHALALLHGGRFAQLEQLITRMHNGPRHLLTLLGGTLGVFEAALEIHRGRLHEGLRRLRPAVEALRGRDPESLLPYALGLAGYASTVVGDGTPAAGFGTQVHSAGYTGPPHLWLTAQAYAAAAEASQATEGPTTGALAGLAAEAREAGLRSTEKDILELCLAVGDLGQVTRLAELTADFEGGEAQALHAYAAAVASGNPDRMVAAAEDAIRAQKYLVAVESIGHAIRFYGNHGNLRRQRALIQQLRRRREELAGVTVSYLSPSLHLVRLTRREHEIVDLLLSGATTKDIAAHFTLSQRTVEGHVYRIYVKLGISRRADLESAYRALEPGPRSGSLL